MLSEEMKKDKIKYNKEIDSRKGVLSYNAWELIYSEKINTINDYLSKVKQLEQQNKELIEIGKEMIEQIKDDQKACIDMTGYECPAYKRILKKWEDIINEH